jgi:hypothetical protein
MKRHPHLRGNSEDGRPHGHHAIHPMHRPGPHQAFGGHEGQDRAAATKEYEGGPKDMAEDAAGMQGRQEPPEPSGFPGEAMAGA